MGILFSRVFQALFGSKEVRILILGLDNAGKTTILYKLQNETDDEEIMTIPTIGFNVETLQYKNIKFQDQRGARRQGVSEALGLPDVRNRQWSIQETCATKGKGLSEGFDWLVTCIKASRRRASRV
ncbi:GTP binding protein [Aureococcus anophagefferens]|nr:GTP binding protein [Aureococcus anophagefferens]